MFIDGREHFERPSIPQDGWMFAPVFIGDGGWWGGWFPPGWWGEWFPDEVVPLLAPVWDQSKSFRVWKEQRWIHLSGAASPNLRIVFDPIDAPPLSQLSNSFRKRDEQTDRQFILQTVFDSGWIFRSSASAFTRPSIDQLLNSFLFEKLDDEPRLDQPVQAGVWRLNLWEGYLYTAIGSQSNSYRSEAEQIDTVVKSAFDSGWIFYIPSVSPFDPDKWPAIFSQTQMPEVREPLGSKDRNDTFSQGWIFYQVPVLPADTQHELLGAVRTVSATINTQAAIPIDLTALFGFVTASDSLVCTNLTIEALN